MTKDEIQKNSEHWYNKYKDAEKRIVELEEKHKQEILDLVLSNSSERAELEKENAELKGSLELYENGCCRAVNECAIKDQLAQAKEILEELVNMEYVINPPADKVRSLMVKAEQFLKEIEK